MSLITNLGILVVEEVTNKSKIHTLKVGIDRLNNNPKNASRKSKSI